MSRLHGIILETGKNWFVSPDGLQNCITFCHASKSHYRRCQKTAMTSRRMNNAWESQRKQACKRNRKRRRAESWKARRFLVGNAAFLTLLNYLYMAEMKRRAQREQQTVVNAWRMFTKLADANRYVFAGKGGKTSGTQGSSEDHARSTRGCRLGKQTGRFVLPAGFYRRKVARISFNERQLIFISDSQLGFTRT